LAKESLCAGSLARSLYENLGGPVFRFDFFDVCVDYGGDPAIQDGAPKEIRLRIANRFSLHRTDVYSLQTNLNVRWLAPEDWTILPSRLAQRFSWRVGSDPVVAAFTIRSGRLGTQIVRLAVEITMDGHPTAMLVPVTLLNGNLRAEPPAD
jgi:hypothetical protein